MIIDPAVKNWLADGVSPGIGVFYLFDRLLNALKQSGIIQSLFVECSGNQGRLAVFRYQPPNDGGVGIDDVAQTFDLFRSARNIGPHDRLNFDTPGRGAL